MLVEITVENLAIIERAQISLGPGLTVLTGETGAGKSLLVDAIELALGERADTGLVRHGASRAFVLLALDLSAKPSLRAECENLGIPVEDGLLTIQREVFAEGRSQCRISGRLTPLSTVKQLGRAIVDLHGQHDHQGLLYPERHLGYLDAWIGSPAEELLTRLETEFAKTESLRRKLAAFRSNVRDREQRIDLLSYQIQEIEGIDPKVGEMEELENRLSRLRHAEKLSDAVHGALASLADSEAAAADVTSGAVRTIEEAARLDAGLEAALDPLRTAAYSMEDAVRELRRYADGLQDDPNALEQTAERIDSLKRLRRKYGDDEAAVIAFVEDAREQLATLAGAEQSEAEIADELASAESLLGEIAGELTELRTLKALEFGRAVQAQIRELAMDSAEFEAPVQRKEIDATGADYVEFFFSANPGEPVRPLAKIASGGEISRVMLAIKTAMAGVAGAPTMIFDEVDSGLGGRAAAVVGRKLEELATRCQVLVISHLAQIAGRATSHFRIEKVEEGGRVRTVVRRLGEEDRLEEIGRMISGEEVSASARDAARDLILRG